MGDHYHAVRGFPPDLKAAVVADALDRGVSQNDVVVGIVASSYSVEFEASGNVAVQPPKANVDQIELRMPVRLWRRLRAAGERRHIPVGQLVLLALADHYGIAYEVPVRRHGRRPSS